MMLIMSNLFGFVSCDSVSTLRSCELYWEAMTPARVEMRSPQVSARQLHNNTVEQ